MLFVSCFLIFTFLFFCTLFLSTILFFVMCFLFLSKFINFYLQTMREKTKTKVKNQETENREHIVD